MPLLKTRTNLISPDFCTPKAYLLEVTLFSFVNFCKKQSQKKKKGKALARTTKTVPKNSKY